jgi:Trp operon repressor
MEHLSLHMEQHDQQQVEWRRDKVQELCSKGYSQREISQMLQVGLATVNRDISYLRNQAKAISNDTLMSGCQKSMKNVLWD